MTRCSPRDQQANRERRALFHHQELVHKLRFLIYTIEDFLSFLIFFTIAQHQLNEQRGKMM